MAEDRNSSKSRGDQGGSRPRPLLLGRYEIGRLLGHGTFAKVYHARLASTGESMAIKVLDKEKILQSGLVAQTKREIAILRRVRHPNIVHLHEVMATKTKIYFVMELVRGGELFARVAKGRLRESAARRYFQQLISAVAFCHARGVFHRDLKPENLLLDDRGDLKVSDFGLSAVSDQMRQDGLFHTFCGTPAYVAPEMLARKGYDGAKADIWSCGVILFVLMAGYLPFQDENLMVMYRKIQKGEFRCPRWFSSELVRLLSRLLDTNPTTRITIPEIMENRWFKKGFRQVKFYIEDDKFHQFDETDAPPPAPLPPPDEQSESESDSDSDSSSNASTSTSSSINRGPRRGLGLPRPASLNAFDLISFSPGFNLSGLFEESGEEARFVSGQPVSTIISKLEEIAKVVSFTVRKKDCQVSLEGTKEGENGPLTIAAEIFELTPSLVVVEVKRKAGDKEEYEEFCNRELKPGLQNLMYGEKTDAAAAASVSSDTEQEQATKRRESSAELWTGSTVPRFGRHGLGGSWRQARPLPIFRRRRCDLHQGDQPLARLRAEYRRGASGPGESDGGSFAGINSQYTRLPRIKIVNRGCSTWYVFRKISHSKQKNLPKRYSCNQTAPSRDGH